MGSRHAFPHVWFVRAASNATQRPPAQTDPDIETASYYRCCSHENGHRSLSNCLERSAPAPLVCPRAISPPRQYASLVNKRLSMTFPRCWKATRSPRCELSPPRWYSPIRKGLNIHWLSSRKRSISHRRGLGAEWAKKKGKNGRGASPGE